MHPYSKMPLMPPRRKTEALVVESASAPDVKAPTAETETAEREEHSEADISPEMVCFRDASETCGNCRHMGSDGMCSVLRMKVEPGDGCNAYAHGGSATEAGDGDEAPETEAVSGLSR